MMAIYPDAGIDICEGLSTKPQRSFRPAAQPTAPFGQGPPTTGEDRLQTCHRGCGAQTGGDNAYDAQNRRALQPECRSHGIIPNSVQILNA